MRLWVLENLIDMKTRLVREKYTSTVGTNLCSNIVKLSFIYFYFICLQNENRKSISVRITLVCCVLISLTHCVSIITKGAFHTRSQPKVRIFNTLQWDRAWKNLPYRKCWKHWFYITITSKNYRFMKKKKTCSYNNLGLFSFVYEMNSLSFLNTCVFFQNSLTILEFRFSFDIFSRCYK